MEIELIEKKLRKKQGSKFSIEYWKKHFPEESIEKLQNRLIEFRTPLLAKRKFVMKLDYWLEKGFSEEDAKLKIKERQSTFSLEKCIKKYGDIEGPIKFKERQDKWQNTLNSKSNEELELMQKSKGLTKDEYIKKHGLEAYNVKLDKKFSTIRYIEKYGEIAYVDLLNKKRDARTNLLCNTFKQSQYSKISLELFDELSTLIQDKCFYKKEEKVIKNKEKDFWYSVDFFYNNKIIEFYGDYYHANPIRFKDIVKIRGKVYNVKDIHNNDAIRIQNISNEGYDVLIIWENDFRTSKDLIINKCINFLKS